MCSTSTENCRHLVSLFLTAWSAWLHLSDSLQETRFSQCSLSLLQGNVFLWKKCIGLYLAL